MSVSPFTVIVSTGCRCRSDCVVKSESNAIVSCCLHNFLLEEIDHVTNSEVVKGALAAVAFNKDPLQAKFAFIM